MEQREGEILGLKEIQNSWEGESKLTENKLSEPVIPSAWVELGGKEKLSALCCGASKREEPQESVTEGEEEAET